MQPSRVCDRTAFSNLVSKLLNLIYKKLLRWSVGISVGATINFCFAVECLSEVQVSNDAKIKSFITMLKSIQVLRDPIELNGFFTERLKGEAAGYHKSICGFKCKYWGGKEWESSYLRGNQVVIRATQATQVITGYLLLDSSRGFQLIVEVEDFMGVVQYQEYRMILERGDYKIDYNAYVPASYARALGEFEIVEEYLYGERVAGCLRRLEEGGQKGTSEYNACFEVGK